MGMICKDLYAMRTVRLIRNAQHTNRVSILCSGAYVSDCPRKRYSYGSGVIHTLLRINLYVI